MKALKLALIGGVAAIAVAGFASAASAEVTVAYNAGVSNDYLFRGIDQSPTSDGQIFAGADLTAGKFYAGVWGSNSAFDSLEYDVYGGYKFGVSAGTLDLGAIYYGYTDGSFNFSDYNNYELKAAVTLPAGPFTLGAAAYWTPDFGNSGQSGLYLEGNAAFTFGNKVTISGAVGQQQFKAGFPIDSYITYNAGVTFPVGKTLSIDLRYVASDSDGKSVFGNEDKGIATVKAVF